MINGFQNERDDYTALTYSTQKLLNITMTILDRQGVNAKESSYQLVKTDKSSHIFVLSA